MKTNSYLSIEEVELMGRIYKMGSESRKLQNLRKWRGPKDKDLSIQKELLSLQRTIKKGNKQLVQISEVWASAVPHHIQENTYPISLKNGVLEIAANGSPTSYQLQRLIREGLLKDIKERCTSSVKRIKITLVS